MTIKQKITTFDDVTGNIIDTRERGLYNPFDPVRGYNFRYKSLSIKSYLDIPLPDVFTDSELGKIFRLSRCIYADSNMLGRRTKSGIRPYTHADIIKVFGVQERQGRALLKKLIDNKVIRRMEFVNQGKRECQFYFNPLYFFSGKYLNLNLFILFQDLLADNLPEHIVKKFLDQAEAATVIEVDTIGADKTKH